MDHAFLLPELLLAAAQLIRQQKEVKARARLRQVCRAFYEADKTFAAPGWVHTTLHDFSTGMPPDARQVLVDVIFAMAMQERFPMPRIMSWERHCTEWCQLSRSCVHPTRLQLCLTLPLHHGLNGYLSIFPPTPSPAGVYRYDLLRREHVCYNNGMLPERYRVTIDYGGKSHIYHSLPEALSKIEKAKNKLLSY
jgi:hypothetical protein